MSDLLIVGAGQLGLMMAAAGARFGIAVDRIDHVSGEILPGTSSMRVRLEQQEILKRYPFITVELEHLLGNPVVEGLTQNDAWLNAEAMRVLPARDQQKALLDQLDVPTSPWQLVEAETDVAVAQVRLGSDLVIKSVRDGYDGKGQWAIDDDNTEQVIADIPVQMYGQLIAEKRIDFEREVSIVGARFPNGSSHFLPIAENYHQEGMLRYTIAPAEEHDRLQEQAEQLLATVMQSLDYIGVMAVEYFDTGNGLLVNEIAPRVHNSGHWSQAGASYSQFDLHLFAILNMANPTPQQITSPTVMLNLIGCKWNVAWQTMPGIQCYWYGKSWRQNRKLGHINITGSTVSALLSCCRQLMPTLDDFHQQMLKLCINRLQPD